MSIKTELRTNTVTINQEVACAGCTRTFMLVTHLQVERWQLRVNRCPTCAAEKAK
jgi:hypothetical protein